MKIPEKIRIAGVDYKITTDNNLVQERAIIGECSHDRCEIKLHIKGRTGDAIMRTLWHEILHAIDANYNGAKLEEAAVERLATGIYQVLADNKLC